MLLLHNHFFCRAAVDRNQIRIAPAVFLWCLARNGREALMKQILGVIGLMLVVAAGAGCTQAPAERTELVVYKSATCGCCKDWIRHLETNGFAVTGYDVQDLAQLKRQNGVSPQLGSCHTARVGGYVIEGHVPAQDIKRLLADRPGVAGLAVPGMPAGSPGMEGPRKDPYNVYTFDKTGNIAVYARY
jgi:hypothetical protein